MHAQRNARRGDSIPVMVAAIVAVVGTAVILFNDFGPIYDSQGSSNGRMITAAAVSRAGAIELPSEPSAILGASKDRGG
jgi:hypothetical protein